MFTRIPRTFTGMQLSTQTPSSLYRWVPGVSSSPGVGLGICLCLALEESCWPRSPAFWHATGMAAQPNGTSGVPTILPGFSHPQIWWGSTLLHHPSDFWRCHSYLPHYQSLWSKYKAIYFKCLHAYLFVILSKYSWLKRLKLKNATSEIKHP